MPSDKTKAKDSLSNVGSLKEQLNSVFKQIKLFQARIDEMKNSSRELDCGFMRSIDLENRCNMLQITQKSGKDPSKAAIFLIRTIIDSLYTGPLSEKDIKSVVVEKCLELGIKSTNRGTIAGLNLDVSAVCGVLAGIGVLEATSPIEGADTTVASSSSSSTASGFGEALSASITARWEADISRYLAEFKRPDVLAAQQASFNTTRDTSSSFKSESSAALFHDQSDLASAFDGPLLEDEEEHDLSLLVGEGDHSLLDVTSGSINHMDVTDHSFSEQLLGLASPPPQDPSSSLYRPRHSLLQEEDDQDQVEDEDERDMFAALASPMLSPAPSTSTKKPPRMSSSSLTMSAHREEEVEEEGGDVDPDDELMRAYLGGGGGDGDSDDNMHAAGGEAADSSFVLDMLMTTEGGEGEGDRARSLSEDSIQLARELLTGGEEGEREKEDEGMSAALNDSDLMDSLLLMPSSSPSAAHNIGGNGMLLQGGTVLFKSETPSVCESVSCMSSVQSSGKTAGGNGKGGGGQQTKGGVRGANNKNKGGGGSGGVGSKPVGSGRKSAAVTRVWRIRSELSDQLRSFVDGSDEDSQSRSYHVLLQPESELARWSSAVSDSAAALEVEEGLLRRLAGQCGFPLRVAPYRLGTCYLDPLYQEVLPPELIAVGCVEGSGGGAVGGLERQVSSASAISGDSQPSGRSRSGSNSSSIGGHPQQPVMPQALYDDQVSITGSFLIDKVRRSKRQRGVCLTSGGSTGPVFSSSHLNTMSTICGNTASGYWNDTLKYAVNLLPVASSSSAPSSSSSKAASSAVAALKKTVGGKGGLDVSALAGLHYPKHYSQPSLLVPDSVDCAPLIKLTPASSSSSSSSNNNNKAPLILSAIHLPDLSVYSQEIPWISIAREFTVLGGEEAGAVFQQPHDPAVSKGGGPLQRTVSKDAGSSSGGHHNQYTKKKSATLPITSSSGSGGVTSLVRSDSQNSLAVTSTSNNKKPLSLPTFEVAAPTFREVQPPSRVRTEESVPMDTEEEEEEEEDISDEAVGARHDAVLRAMREKWAQLQALKAEHSRRGSGGDYIKKKGVAGGGEGQQGEGGEDVLSPVHYSGSGSHMKYKKYLNGSSSSGGDGKKRGHNMMGGGGGNLKRRGRPPKVAKTAHPVVAGPILPGSFQIVSQRGNNQYTAIRAAAAAAAYAQQQQQLSDAATSSSDVSSTGAEGIAAMGEDFSPSQEQQQQTASTEQQQQAVGPPSHHSMDPYGDGSDLVDEPDDAQIEAALSMLMDSSDNETDDEGEGDGRSHHDPLSVENQGQC